MSRKLKHIMLKDDIKPDAIAGRKSRPFCGTKIYAMPEMAAEIPMCGVCAEELLAQYNRLASQPRTAWTSAASYTFTNSASNAGPA